MHHASGYIHIEHQVAFNAAQTLLSKHHFEHHCQDMGAAVVNYQTYNGVFNEYGSVEWVPIIKMGLQSETLVLLCAWQEL